MLMETDQNLEKKKNIRTILLILGILILIIAVYFLKTQKKLWDDTANDNPKAVLADETAEEHYERLIQNGEPIFMFFRSDSCEACLEMKKIVDQIFPDYEEKIAFIDVDAYDPQNNSLMKRAHIQAIPTLFFIDKNGQASYAVGVMEAEQFQDQLQLLIEAN